MNLSDLIEKRKAKISIIGMGYVGLPHAVSIVNAGFFVYGIDINKDRVESLNRGKSYVGDIKDKKLKEIIKSKRFKATDNFKVLKESDVIIICVPTPLDKNKVPDISYIVNSVKEIKNNLKKNTLVILESTTYPGTTEEVLFPMLRETKKNFYLAFAPERIDPGNKMATEDVPKVVGGINLQSSKIASLFYSQFLKSVHLVSSPRTAEMSKILENTFRLINISMINELALLSSRMNIDIWEVIEAAKTKPYGFMPFYPSPKVGGHCISLDPFYLSYKAKEYNFWAKFIELAGEINEQMPHFVVTTIIFALNKAKKSLNGSKILIIGASYKKDIGDSRESAIYDISWDLKRKGAKIDYFDPYIKEIINLKSIKYSEKKIKEYDLLLILTDHSILDYEKMAKSAKLIVDTRNAIKSRKHKNVFRI